MARTEIYVDPSIAGDSGTGSVGDPYGDFQYCLSNETFDTTNGTRINAKAGTDEILGAALDFATDFTAGGGPAHNNPGLIIQGYTSAAGDGGSGGINGNGSYGPMNQTGLGGTALVDMHLHNSGSATLVSLGNYSGMINCELNHTTGNGSSNVTAYGCHYHDIGGDGAIAGVVVGCYFKNETKSFTNAVTISGLRICLRNIISLSGNSNGIYSGSTYAPVIQSNSIFNTAAGSGTGKGIRGYASQYAPMIIANNIVEGFSVNYDPIATVPLYSMFGNAAFNGGTNYGTEMPGWIGLDTPDNEVLGSTGFAKSGSDTFANRFAYFAPLDVGNVRGGSWPVGCRLDKGAVQHADAGGGGLSLIQTRRSTLIGR